MSTLTPAGAALNKALLDRGQGSASPDCVCDYVDIGIGTQKVSEDPDCPACTLPGFASWALERGTAEEQHFAALYLREWEAAMSLQAVTEAARQAHPSGLRTVSSLEDDETVALTADQYVEWSAGLTGRNVWLSFPDRGDATLGYETNWMAQARPGAVTNGYAKTEQSFAGMTVWRKVS